MSAIAGVYYRDGRPAAPDTLPSLLARLDHRGPDGAAAWHAGPVALGHLWLRTTPVAEDEHLPLIDPPGPFVLTADARLDNRAELIAALGFGGRPGATIPDSALILAAYRRWGAECPAYLLGDFAFALWDAPRQRLFCARDPCGVRQFHYYCDARLFAFATEIGALFGCPEVPRRLDDARLGDYLAPLLDDPARTLFAGIYRLPPAHGMVVTAQALTIRRYWAPDPGRTIRLRSDEEYAEAYRELFTEAVRSRLPPSGRPGATLSGGLDSSAIVCVARQERAAAGAPPLATFSAVYDAVPASDEREYIEAVLVAGGLAPHYVHPDRLSPLADWADVAGADDEPIWNPQMALHWAIYEAAQAAGVRVLLDGYGGDFVVSHGIAYLAELTRRGHWVTLRREARGLAAHYGRSSRRVVWQRGLLPLLPAPPREAWRRLRAEVDPAGGFSAPVRPEYARRTALRGRFAAAQVARRRSARSSRQEHLYQVTAGSIGAVALPGADRASARFGLEVRYPFLDRRLVEFCLALPPEQKIAQGWTRLIVRRALAGTLPDAVCWRGGKANLGPAAQYALLTHGRAALVAALWESPPALGEYVDLDVARLLYHCFLAAPDARLAYQLWQVAVLSNWLQQTGFGGLGPPPDAGASLVAPLRKTSIVM